MSEEWKTIAGFDDYRVSALGQVFSIPRMDKLGREVRGGLRQIYKRNDGYCFVALSKDGKKSSMNLGRLVAIAFIPNPAALPEVNHKDGNRSNNVVENLEWVTSSENISHSYKQLGRIAPRPSLGRFGSAHHRSKAVVATHLKTGERLEFGSMLEAERSGYTRSCVQSCIRGTRKTHKGCSWSFQCPA